MKSRVSLIFLIKIQVTLFACLLFKAAVGQNETMYKSARPNGYADYIKLRKVNDSLFIGVYDGVEEGVNHQPYFYRSEFVGRPAGNYDLTFELINYTITDTIVGKRKLVMPYHLPEIIKKPMSFLGEFKDGNLQITRITNKHLFSAADVFLFIDVKDEKPLTFH